MAWGHGTLLDVADDDDHIKYRYAFRPICCLHVGPVSKEKQRFGPFWGNEEELGGTKKTKKLHQILVHFWGGPALFGGSLRVFLFLSQKNKYKTRHRDARGTSEVLCGASPFHVHCPASRSSN